MKATKIERLVTLRKVLEECINESKTSKEKNTYGEMKEKVLDLIAEEEKHYNHTITITEMKDLRTDDGKYGGTEEIAMPVHETTDHRPDRESFCHWLRALYPQYDWAADDGEDWNENEATDFCQYVAFIDPKDMSHILLASYYKESKNIN